MNEWGVSGHTLSGGMEGGWDTWKVGQIWVWFLFQPFDNTGILDKSPVLFGPQFPRL